MSHIRETAARLLAAGTVAAFCVSPTAGSAHGQDLLVAMHDTGRLERYDGRTGEWVRTHGHSMMVSPWGEVAAELGDEEGVAIGAVREDEVNAARSRLAALKHMRGDL